jgi:hypothetical protein
MNTNTFKTIRQLYFGALLATFLGWFIGDYFGKRWYSPNPILSTAQEEVVHFIHPDYANCTRVIGLPTDRDGVTEDLTHTLKIYLCKTEDNKFYYVRVTPATQLHSRRNHPFVKELEERN